MFVGCQFVCDGEMKMDMDELEQISKNFHLLDVKEQERIIEECLSTLEQWVSEIQ